MINTRLALRFSVVLAACLAACFTSLSPAAAVVGATTEDGRFANRVVMVLTRGGDKEGFCTGVVLAPRVVLTAAHCLGAVRDMAVHYRDEAGRPVLVAVRAAVAHPLYRADAIVKRVESIDLGLVETATPLADVFAAAPLATGEGPAVGDAAILAGYGVGREGDAKTGGALRSAKLQVRAPLSRILLWAEDPGHAGVGACSGDSGGPLFSADGDSVVAIVAWTSGSHGGHCGALTQGPLVAPQRDWIDAVLARWRQ
jgi:hypothetical protein